jgi:AraC-like DNA-binding protein
MQNTSPNSVQPPMLEFTLQDVPRRRRFAVMRDLLATVHPPLVRATMVAERADSDAAFDAGFSMRRAGDLTCVEHFCDELAYTRSPHDVGASPIDCYGLFLQMEGVWHLSQGNSEQVVKPGSALLLDSNQPFRSIKRGRTRHRTIRVSHAQADRLMVSGWQRTGLLCDGATGLGRVIATYARTLSDEIDSLTPHAATEGLNHLVGLLALHDPARRDRLGSARESLRAARLAQVCRYIGDNLTEHRMTPSVVAIANGMSERSLHLLFEHTGETFARYLQRRRLQECRFMLTSAEHARRSITEIVFACGFNSLATFYRAFQREFGAAPGDLRAAMLEQEGRTLQ